MDMYFCKKKMAVTIVLFVNNGKFQLEGWK